VLAYAHAVEGRFGRAYELASGLEASRDVTSAEWDLARALVSEDSHVRPIPASSAVQGPLELAATMAWNAREADRWLKGGQYRQAAETYSALLLEELAAPWPAERTTLEQWIDGLRRAQDGYRWNRDADWPSIDVTVEPGKITEAILARGVAPERLTVYETDPVFAGLLRQRFPGVTVVEADARTLADGRLSGVGAVNSGLPLLTIPARVQRQIVEAAFACMRPGGAFVQFTYGWRPPVDRPVRRALGLVWTASRWILGNLPPARVYTFRLH